MISSNACQLIAELNFETWCRVELPGRTLHPSKREQRWLRSESCSRCSHFSAGTAIGKTHEHNGFLQILVTFQKTHWFLQIVSFDQENPWEKPGKKPWVPLQISARFGCFHSHPSGRRVLEADDFRGRGEGRRCDAGDKPRPEFGTFPTVMARVIPVKLCLY